MEPRADACWRGSRAGCRPRSPPRRRRTASPRRGRTAITLLTLGVLGGAFIAFGAIFSNVALTGAEALPFGLARSIAGLVFTVGLALVLVGGAQIFTGDVLMVMAWASGRLGGLSRVAGLGPGVDRQPGRGAWAQRLLVLLAGHHLFGGGQVGVTALRTAEAKAALPFGQAFILGMLCNTLVCLAVWLSLSSRQPAHRVIVIVLPIAAFVAAGFEHAVANMYLLGFGLMVKMAAAEGFWEAISLQPATPFRTSASSASRRIWWP